VKPMELPNVCVACDCVCDPADIMYFSLNAAGPFCDECWQSLSDPDQALVTEKRLEEAEARIEELEAELKRLQSV
jgi:hypothetical protein